MSKKYCDEISYFSSTPAFFTKVLALFTKCGRQSIMKHISHCFKACLGILDLVSLENGEENALN